MALVALEPDALLAWARENEIEHRDFADLTRTPQVRELVEGYVEQLNAEINSWERIKRFVVIDRELTVENGDLTPCFKLRRKAVEGSFEADIQAQYNA